MNEQAIIDSYNLFVQNGYKKSLQEFKQLLASNPNALNDSYGLFQQNGYTKSLDEYKALMGVGGAQAPIQPAAQAPAAEEVKKKESTTALPSADGGLAQQGPKNRAPLFKPEGFDKQMPAAADATFVKKPKLDLVEKKVATAVDDRALEVEKRKAEDLFDKQTVKPRVDQSVYLKERLSNINKNLINREEEYVVPEMEYQFGDLGFKFEEAGATGDWMNVTAPNGQKIQISLDNFLDSKSQKEADKLQKFIQDNTPQKGLFVLEKTMREQDKKFNSQKQVDDEIKKINTDVTALNQKQKNFLLKKTAYENEIAELEKTPASQRNTEQFNAKLNQLEQRRAAMTEEVQSILGEEEAIKNKGKALDTSVGKYTIAKSKQGTWGGGIWDSFLGGIGKMASAAASTTIDIMTEIAPAGFGMSPQDVKNVTIEKAAKIGVAPPTVNQNIEDWKKTLTPQQLDDWEDEMDDYIKKSLKKEVLPSTRVGLKTLVGDPDTTLEWENLKKQGFWGGAFLGLAESLPAMIGGSGPAGWAQRTAQMYGQVSDGLAQEMENDPDFANISENEKLAITLPIGITSAVLEAYGLKNVLASTGIINKITMSALGKAGRGVGAKSFRELVENEVQSRLLKGTLILGAAGLAEGETGALQEVSETTFKAIYNEIKGKDMFETPESALDFVENVVVAGAQEAVGGFVLGVPSAVSSAYSQKGFLKMDDNVFRTFELMANDETLQSAYIAKLKEKIANGEITVEEGKNKLNDYRNSVGLFRQLPDGLTTQQKKEAMNLLKEKRDLEQYVNGKDASLVSRQKNRINAINEELTKISEQDGGQVQSETTPEATKRRERIVELLKVLEDDNTAIEYDTSNKLPLEERNKVIEEIKTLKAEEDAVQKQATSQVPVQSGAGVSQEVAQGEPQAEPQVATQEGVQEEVVSSKTRVNIAPFFNTKVETVQEAEQLRQAPEYKAYKETLVKLAEQLGIPGIIIDDVIGGYKNESGEEIVEISNQITFENATLDQVEEYAAMIAALAPEVQEASIAAQYVNEGDATHNANEYRFKVNNIDNAIKALKGAGITDFSINENESTVTFTDVFDFADAQLQDKIGKFAELLDENNTTYEQQQFRPTESRYVDKGKRKEIIRRVKSDGARPESRGQGFNEAVEQAIQRDAAFQGTTYEEYSGAKPKGPAAGNRLFNEPIKAVAEIANRYYQRAFGTKRPDFKGTRQLDKARAKRISDAFDAMKHSPNDPQVRAAYNALAKETIAQYQAFLDAGYVVEINNQEPYANSQEMIDDLRNNKRIKIFSTESGFGDTPITAKQRKENPLLAKTKFTDVNGQPMLVNDLFRAVHDFFGHAELGNSFGPLGEENAWNVHARMYSPLARRAMTTETRGQNSYVNFSGVNEEADKIREQSRKLREEGKLEEALKLTDEIYEKTSFADQKVGLLPEEFSQIDEEVTAEPVAEPVAEAEVVEEFVPISYEKITGAAFTKENAIDYEEDTREDTKGRQYTYLSSITTEVVDDNGEKVGTITKLSDGEGLLSFTAEDLNGRTVAKGKEFPTLRDAKVALAEATNKIRQKEFDKQQKAVTKEKEAAKSKADKAKAREAAKKKAKEPQVEEEVVEEVQGKMDELLELDPKQKGTGQKILDGLDSMIKDIEKFEKGTLGVNIALPIMKGILQTIRALVQAGMTLQEAIKKAAKDSGTTVKQVVNGINAIGQIAPIQEAYDALMAKADALIARQKSRGIADKKIVSNLDTMIRNSDVYKNATDAQRKIMEREARVKMGVGPRKAASIGRVIGVLKDITNVSRQEKLQIISRIRELSRDVAKDLAQEIKDLAKEGKITAVQAANVVARFGNVNLLNEMSVSNFVDYMAKVFADADYDNKIKGARSKIAKARNNIATKIGIADGLMLPLQKLFSINPELIPDAQLERYLELLKMFSASDAVLTLENKVAVKKDVDAILKDIDAEQSKADELAEIFSNSKNQVFNDEGDLDYAASLKKMVKEGDITEEDAELMRKYKQDIIPQVEPTPLSDEEIAKKKEEQIADLKKAKVVTDGLPSRDENRLAKRLADLIANTSKEDLMKLSLTDLKNLLKVVNNINNGYLPHYAQIMVEKINAIKYGKILAAAIKAAKPLKFSELYSRFKAAIIRSQKGGIAEMVRRNPLYYIDQVFGDFKTKNIFEALFEQTAEAEANFKAELKKVQTILEKAEAKVAKSFNLNPDETLMSKFKMMTYMIQLEYESNKGSEQVNPAAAYLRETIKHIDGGKSRFGERDANMLQDILTNYSKDGEIDNEKLFNSFNQAEKDAISDIRKVNESLKDKAQYTAAIIRGDAIDPLNNYVHLNVLHDTEPLDVSAATDFLNQANNSRRPSTKAKSLISRTKGAKPLNFDVFASAQRGAKFVILDYNLTEPIRTARRTMNQATAELEEQGRIPKMQRDVKNAIDGAFEEAVSNLLTNSILQNSLADEAIDFISKQGYRAVLAGTGRFAAELTSNISYALLADPKAFTTGAKYKGLIMSTLAPAIMENVGSKQTNRIFPNTTLSGSFVDTSILSQATGIQGTSSKNPVLNKMQQIYNLTGKKYQNVIELTADTLISTPDKLVMRPMWFGAFANEFKKASGSEVDFDKIAANDKAYMDANQDAIQKAKRAADQKSVMTGATDNAFMGILKGTVKPNQTFSSRAFNNFNNYMTRFLIFEYVTARTAIYAMVGDGTLSKRQGAAMLAAVATRMTVYTLLSQMMANGIMGLFGIGDDEEEDEKSLMQKIGQSLTGTFTSLLIGRDFGNATKLVINYGLEEINERHLDFLREGEYDPYKDGIAYSIIPREDRPDDNLGNLLMNMTGSLGPAYNTANLIYKNRNRIVTGETEKKELDAIEREDRTVKERIPLELLGNFGLIPFYKDVKKMVNKSIYASIKEAERVAERNKRRDTDLLGGYENKTDLKRYNPELYEKNFGEGSEWYESTKEEREAKEKEAKEEQKIKDRMNNYTPEGEGGFGSAGFGKKKSSKKSSGGGFGGKKFGGN
jgi:hypothetical protein